MICCNGVLVFVDYFYMLDVVEIVFKVMCLYVMGKFVVIVGVGGDCDLIKWFLMGKVV